MLSESATDDDYVCVKVCAQFALRGHETRAGSVRGTGHIDKGGQRIYQNDDGVIWDDLIVHLGARPESLSRAACFIVPPYDGSRASLRVYRASKASDQETKWFEGAQVRGPLA